MTDRLNGLIIVLDHQIREDDAHGIIAAIQMIKGVQSVSGIVADANDFVVRSNEKSILARKLQELISDLWITKK